MDYIEWNIKLEPRSPWSEILVAQLGEEGFDSFVDTEDGVQAYIPQKQRLDLDKLKNEFITGLEKKGVNVSVEEKTIPHQNWNAQWEESFDPVDIENLLTIRAPFHKADYKTKMEVVIQPKMSFGTGHHQTTWMMCKALFDLQPLPEKVLDMGSGTGVLAILAKKLGAKDIWGIDIEEGAVENAIENAERNDSGDIRFDAGDVDLLIGIGGYDLILANINKNILTAQIPSYSRISKPGAKLLLSGFFDSDVADLLKAAKEFGYEEIHTYTREHWAAILLKK
jgi:ribosomal protein L11 methyltransferase